MMKIAVIADTHLGQYWKTNPQRAHKIVDYFIKNLEKISEESDKLVIMGDFLHSVNLSPDCISVIHDYVLPRMYSYFNEIFLIVGNHETFIDFNNSQKSYPKFIMDENICKIYENGVSLIKELSNDKFAFYAIPFQKNLENRFEYTNQLINSDILKREGVIFGHFTPTEIFERFELTVQPLMSNEKIKKILLGDYHDPKNVIKYNCELISIGSTYFTNIADITKNATKRYLILDTNTLEIEQRALIQPKIKYANLNRESDLSKIFDEKDLIYYIESSTPFDFTEYIADGFDIYFRYLESEKFKKTIEGVSIDTSNFVDVSTCWPDYLKVQHYSEDIKNAANNIFMNRNFITPEEILKLIGGQND